MYWNYRIVDHGDDSQEADNGERFQLVEVYYDGVDDEPIGYVEKIMAYGENVEEIRDNLELIEKALEKPVIPIAAFYPDGQQLSLWDDDGGAQ